MFDDIVWGYAVPLAIPLLLLNANILKIWRETGRLLAIFLIGAAGTLTGAIVGTILLSRAVEGLVGVLVGVAEKVIYPHKLCLFFLFTSHNINTNNTTPSIIIIVT